MIKVTPSREAVVGDKVLTSALVEEASFDAAPFWVWLLSGIHLPTWPSYLCLSTRMLIAVLCSFSEVTKFVSCIEPQKNVFIWIQ